MDTVKGDNAAAAAEVLPPSNDPPMNTGAPTSAPLMQRDDAAETAKKPEKREMYSSDLPPCWFIRCKYCCCGGCYLKKPHPPFKVRSVDFFSLLAFQSNGAFVGGTFDRAHFETTLSIKVGSGFDVDTGIDSNDITVPSKHVEGLNIPVRVFSPPKNTKPKKPIMIYFHGGAFVQGHPNDLLYHATGCNFSKAGDMYVVSVDYRLAPENKFPAAVEDSFDVVRWICSKPADVLPADANSSEIILFGEGSGAALAMIVATLARDGLGPDLKTCEDTKTMKFTNLVLAYPTIFMESESSMPFYSPMANKPIIDFAFTSYLKNSCGDKPIEEIIRFDRRVRPIISGFQDLPPTVMITGGFDPFRPGNDLAVAELRQAGVVVDHHHYDTEPHGFISLGTEISDSAELCMHDIISDIKKQRNQMYVGRKFGINAAKGAVGKVIKVREEDQIAELDLGWAKAYCPVDNLIIVASEAERKRRGSLVT